MMQGQGGNSGPRLGQLGFLSQRTWGILLVCCLLAVVPYWMAKKTSAKTPTPAVPSASQRASSAAPAAPNLAAAVAAVVVASTPVEQVASAAPKASPDRFGLSFGHGLIPSKYADNNWMHSACAGAPWDMGNSDKNQCNPQQGDSSCRTALPVLCVLKDASTAESVGLVNEPKVEGAPKGPDFYAAWVGGTLAATAPVAGFILGSRAQANARCASELGAGWRMAEIRDAGTGVSLVGKRGLGLVHTHTRHWVAVHDQKSNCWDPT
jgi:hypothetical protein